MSHLGYFVDHLEGLGKPSWRLGGHLEGLGNLLGGFGCLLWGLGEPFGRSWGSFSEVLGSILGGIGWHLGLYRAKESKSSMI